MFRDMLRKKQQLPQEECIELLKSEMRGVLSVQGDDGYPYGLPMDHWYCEEDGHLYFHCGRVGHKLDAIRRCDKVSYCIYDQGYREEGDWALYIRSVIIFGRAKIVEDQARAMEICRRLSYKYTQDSEYIEREIRESGPHTLVFELIPEHMTGKKVHEA